MLDSSGDACPGAITFQSKDSCSNPAEIKEARKH